ncbi:hypothetical protein H5410_027062 [Solanum commersonii]|uniref:Reverse transcriptase domain-containing protein n=1 Tax=Solanum commersonii TaxID=4109 RepID=A0A9J5YYT2_SOLCO|nr:hypothetical protein H5410_027062 [Solanum commersonii]
MEQRKVAIRKQPAIQSVSGLENKLKMEITNLEILGSKWRNKRRVLRSLIRKWVDYAVLEADGTQGGIIVLWDKSCLSGKELLKGIDSTSNVWLELSAVRGLLDDLLIVLGDFDVTRLPYERKHNQRITALTLGPWSKTPPPLHGWIDVCSRLTGMTDLLHQTSCLMQNRKEQEIQWNSNYNGRGNIRTSISCTGCSSTSICITVLPKPFLDLTPSVLSAGQWQHNRKKRVSWNWYMGGEFHSRFGDTGKLPAISRDDNECLQKEFVDEEVLEKLSNGIHKRKIDNRKALIANECLDSRLKQKRTGILCNFNTKKAFDHIHWNFLLDQLREMGSLPSPYLRLPSGYKHKSIVIWNNILEKFERKLSNWKRQYLPLGGRLGKIRLDIWELRLEEFGLLLLAANYTTSGEMNQILHFYSQILNFGVKIGRSIILYLIQQNDGSNGHWRFIELIFNALFRGHSNVTVTHILFIDDTLILLDAEVPD